MKKYIDKAEPMCYNSLKPMKRRSRLKPDFPASCGRSSVAHTPQNAFPIALKGPFVLIRNIALTPSATRWEIGLQPTSPLHLFK